MEEKKVSSIYLKVSYACMDLMTEQGDHVGNHLSWMSGCCYD